MNFSIFYLYFIDFLLIFRILLVFLLLYIYIFLLFCYGFIAFLDCISSFELEIQSVILFFNSIIS